MSRPISNIKFIHCRNTDKNGTIHPTGGLTIAYNLNSDFKVVGWAAAKCHEKDLYNKQVGRMKSSGRLLSERYYQEAPEIDETTFIKQTKDGYVSAFIKETA